MEITVILVKLTIFSSQCTIQVHPTAFGTFSYRLHCSTYIVLLALFRHQFHVASAEDKRSERAVRNNDIDKTKSRTVARYSRDLAMYYELVRNGFRGTE